MPRYYVPASGNIQPGDTLWDHGPTTNNNIKATREVDPDTNNRSRTMVGTATAVIGGARIRTSGMDLVIDATSKTGVPGTVVGTVAFHAGAPAVPPAIPKPTPGLPPAKPMQPGVIDTTGAQPIGAVADGPADSLIGDALQRDPDTGKLPKKPYVPDRWEDFKRDDFWDILKDAAR